MSTLRQVLAELTPPPVTPEFDEVRRIAEAQGRPARELLEAVRMDGARQPGQPDRESGGREG